MKSICHICGKVKIILFIQDYKNRHTLICKSCLSFGLKHKNIIKKWSNIIEEVFN